MSNYQLTEADKKMLTTIGVISLFILMCLADNFM